MRGMAMNQLGNGLHEAEDHADALTVKEAELALMRRVGAPEWVILAVQSNLANTYSHLGRDKEALSLRQDVYFGRLKLHGEEHESTIGAAVNYGSSLMTLKRFEEARKMLRKMMRVARRILGDSHDTTLNIRWGYAQSLYTDDGATLNDLREAVETLADAERIARRVFGGAHPLAMQMEHDLKKARAKLRACETLAEAMAATTLGDA